MVGISTTRVIIMIIFHFLITDVLTSILHFDHDVPVQVPVYSLGFVGSQQYQSQAVQVACK